MSLGMFAVDHTGRVISYDFVFRNNDKHGPYDAHFCLKLKVLSVA